MLGDVLPHAVISTISYRPYAKRFWSENESKITQKLVE